jgi:hypothetical protein
LAAVNDRIGLSALLLNCSETFSPVIVKEFSASLFELSNVGCHIGGRTRIRPLYRIRKGNDRGPGGADGT